MDLPEWIALALAAVLLAEVALRLSFRQSAHCVWRPYLALDLHLDPAVLPAMRSPARIRINSRGERGDEAPAGPHLSVLVAGGSAPECYFLDQDETWSAQLQRLLNQPDALHALRAPTVHVANVGRSFTCSAALDYSLTRTLPDHAVSQIAILMVGGNDIAFWLQDGAPGERAPFVPNHDHLFGQHPTQRFGVTPRRTALAEAARRLRARWFRPVHQSLHATARLQRVRSYRTAALRLLTTVPDAAPMLRHFERNVRMAVMRLRARGARVIVAAQPCCAKPAWSQEELAAFWGYADGDAESAHAKVYYDMRIVANLFRRVAERAGAVAAELGAEFVDPQPLLPADLRHFYDFAHVTALGAQVIASSVAAQVLQGAP